MATSAFPVASMMVLASTKPRPWGVATTAPFTRPSSTHAPQPMAPSQISAARCLAAEGTLVLYVKGVPPRKTMPSGAAKIFRPSWLVGLLPGSSSKRSVAHKSSPRYGRGAARKTLTPLRAAAVAAATACAEPPTTTTSTEYATGIRRADSVSARA